MSLTRVAVCCIAGATLAVLAACDEVGEIGNTCESTGGLPVDATDGGVFVPDSLQITPTQRVCWQNQGTVTHTVTIKSSVGADSLDTTLPPDFTYTIAFNVVRDYDYYCRFHAETGVIQVR